VSEAIAPNQDSNTVQSMEPSEAASSMSPEVAQNDSSGDKIENPGGTSSKSSSHQQNGDQRRTTYAVDKESHGNDELNISSGEESQQHSNRKTIASRWDVVAVSVTTG